MKRRLVGLALSLLSLGACSSSDGGGSSLAEGRPECLDLAGHEITQSVTDTGCVIASEKLVSMFTVEECTDGRRLAYNHFGWGFIGSALMPYPRALDAAPPSEALHDCGPARS